MSPYTPRTGHFVTASATSENNVGHKHEFREENSVSFHEGTLAPDGEEVPGFLLGMNGTSATDWIFRTPLGDNKNFSRSEYIPFSGSLFSPERTDTDAPTTSVTSVTVSAASSASGGVGSSAAAAAASASASAARSHPLIGHYGTYNPETNESHSLLSPTLGGKSRSHSEGPLYYRQNLASTFAAAAFSTASPVTTQLNTTQLNSEKCDTALYTTTSLSIQQRQQQQHYTFAPQSPANSTASTIDDSIDSELVALGQSCRTNLTVTRTALSILSY